jgi:hypothetical protein
MTYLELVNGVLRRLRENTVGSVTQNTYSELIGDMVNDSKRIVEDAWDWSALRSTLTATTTAGAFNYVLTGSGNRIKLIDVVNDTSNWFLTYKDSHWMTNAYLNQEAPSGAPRYFTFNGVDANGDTQVDLYPKPDGAYTIRFNCILRQDDLVNDTDQLLVPHMPVVHLAFAMAARERGETGGRSAGELMGFAQNYLSDAVALDAQKHPEETVYMAV